MGHQLERVLWENEELRRALASRTSGASEGKGGQKPVESAELRNGNLLPMGSQPVAPSPSRSAPCPCGLTVSPPQREPLRPGPAQAAQEASEEGRQQQPRQLPVAAVVC